MTPGFELACAQDDVLYNSSYRNLHHPTVAGVAERNPIVKCGAEEKPFEAWLCLSRNVVHRVALSVSDTFGSWLTLVGVDPVFQYVTSAWKSQPKVCGRKFAEP